jgi:hypothetical protein
MVELANQKGGSTTRRVSSLFHLSPVTRITLKRNQQRIMFTSSFIFFYPILLL